MSIVKPLLCLAVVAPVFLAGASLYAAPKTSAPPAPIARHVYKIYGLPSGSPAQHDWMSFGNVIPPCDMVFGYTDQGVTGQDGHLLLGVTHGKPHWTFTTAPPKTQRR